MIVDYLAVGRAALGAMPTQDRLVLERFFDDTGGMQLVLHSPFGGRINRSLGLMLRKKFCRTFNFELQAAATDDAVVLSLGPHHSFPLDEVPRYLSSRTVRDTLEHAVLDAPMFQARWRWNLNRALMVLRFRNGKRNPPPIQRMESDDLLAAVFPQAAACQDNATGPIEIPDHLLVRQTIDDTLHEALDIDGVQRLLERIEPGRWRCTAARPPSPRCSPTRSSPPGPTPSSTTRSSRTGGPTPSGCAAASTSTWPPSAPSTPRPSTRCTPRSLPEPASPDDLHDLLSSLVVSSPRPEWRELWTSSAGPGPGADRSTATARSCGAPPRRRPEAGLALSGDDDGAAARVVRGHLELSGITTVERLAGGHRRSRPGRVAVALARLQQEGFALQGRYTPGATGTEWVARRLLARMHSYSRRSRRESVQPATAQDFMRFLLRWQHVAPGTQLGGDAALPTVIEQLQGFEAAAVAWEPELLARRLRHYSHGLAGPPLPRRRGGLAPAGPASPRRRRRRAPPPRRRPRRSPWCSGRISTGCSRRPGPERPLASPRSAPRPRSSRSCGQRGASFASDLAAATRRLPDDVERGLWEGVTRGLIMCDGFGAIRARVASGRARPPARRLSRLGRAAPANPGSAAAGRWALVPAPDWRHRPRRPGRSRRRAAAPPLGRGVPRPGRPRLAPPALAGAAVGPAPAGGSGPGPGRPVRDRLQRRAVRPARSGRAAGPRPQGAPQRRAGGRQRHRPAQPGRPDRARRCGPGGADQPGGVRRRRAGDSGLGRRRAGRTPGRAATARRVGCSNNSSSG